MGELLEQYYDDLSVKIIIGNVLINILCLRYSPPGLLLHVRNHCHSTYELHFIPEGKGILKTPFHGYHDIKPGVLYITGPGINHLQEADTKMPMAEYTINFEFSLLKKTDGIYEIYPKDEARLIFNAYENSTFWFGEADQDSLGYLEKIFTELSEKRIGYYTTVKNLISQIIINTARLVAKAPKASYLLPLKSYEDKRKRILDLQIFKLYNTEISKKDLASTLGVSTRHLDRILYREYKMSFKELITSVRIKNALYFMETTDMSITQICQEIGFSSLSYFCQVFKKATGSPPSAYKEKLKE